jgi:hypothetical protein
MYLLLGAGYPLRERQTKALRCKSVRSLDFCSKAKELRTLLRLQIV